MSDFLEESQWVRQVRSPKFEVRVNRTAAHPRFFILHSSFFILHSAFLTSCRAGGRRSG